MLYRIARTNGDFETSDAAKLTQRLVPLARMWRSVYLTRAEGKMDDKTKLQLRGTLSDLAEEMVTQILCFVNENPWSIPSE